MMRTVWSIINGVKVLERPQFLTGYAQFSLQNAEEAIKPGTNVIAIYCKQTGGGQYIDAGLSRKVPPKDTTKKVW